MTVSTRNIDGVKHVWSIADNAWVTLDYWNYINGRKPKTNGTSSGIELTDDLVEELADEAEQGYPTELLRPRGEGSTPSLLAGSTIRESYSRLARRCSLAYASAHFLHLRPFLPFLAHDYRE